MVPAQVIAKKRDGIVLALARGVLYGLRQSSGAVIWARRVGIDTTNLIARQVGVRGKSRFNEGLRFRLLDVRDIDALDDDR